jgi:hypothetical protein
MSLGIINGPARIDEHELEPFDHGDNGAYIVEYTTGRKPAELRVRRFYREHFEDAPTVELEMATAKSSAQFREIAKFYDEYRTMRAVMSMAVGK